MKRFSFALLTLASILLVLPTLAQSDVVELTNSYTSDDGTVIFQYPDGWSPTEEEDRISLTTVDDLREQISIAEIAFFFLTDDLIDQTGISSDDNAEDAMVTIIEVFAEQGLEFGDTESMVLGGKNVVLALADTGFENFLTATIETDGGLLLGQVSGPGDQVAVARPHFIAIIESLTFSDDDITEDNDSVLALPNTYDSADGQLSFDYPDNWDVDTEDNGFLLGPIAPLVDEIPDVQILILYLTGELGEQLGISADDNAEDAMNAVEILFSEQGFEFGEIELTELGGKDVAISLVQSEEQNFLIALVETEVGLMTVQATGPLDQIDLIEADLRAMIASLTINESDDNSEAETTNINIELSSTFVNADETLTFQYPDDDWFINEEEDRIVITPPEELYDNHSVTDINIFYLTDELVMKSVFRRMIALKMRWL